MIAGLKVALVVLLRKIKLLSKGTISFFDFVYFVGIFFWVYLCSCDYFSCLFEFLPFWFAFWKGICVCGYMYMYVSCALLAYVWRLEVWESQVE